MSRTSPKTWPVADALFVEVEIRHPRERQMHIPFEGGPRLVIGSSHQIPLAAELIGHLRKMERSLIKRRTIRPKFRRKDDRTLPPLVAPAPASPLPGGVPTFGFTAEPIISKYADHLSLCRQQTILQRLGLHAPRDTLNHWTLQSLELLRPVTEAIHLECLAKSYLQLDDWSGATKTTNRSPQGTSGGEDHPPHQRTRPRHRKNAHRIRLGVQ